MDLKDKISVIRNMVSEKKKKTDDLDIIVNQVMKLPYGQLKKVLTDKVMEVLAKYGYTGG